MRERKTQIEGDMRIKEESRKRKRQELFNFIH
jgi:hypothetical protein